MIIIGEVVISDDVLEQQFMCNLQACRGACCWEGDFGAPLDDAELPVLQGIYPAIQSFLTEEGREVLENEGLFTFYEDANQFGTPLINGGACAYLTYDALGIAQCGIEKAHQAGATAFRKPISCHLYPVRISREPAGFELMNYERWDICKAACSLGAEKQMPVYKFVKDAIIRKYGEAFFEELAAAAQHFAEEE